MGEDYAYILDTLQKGEEKVEELKDRNQELVQANQRLVDLVKKLESILVEEVGEDFDWEDNQYNYPDRWTPSEIIHEKDLELKADVELEDIDNQIQEAIRTMKRAEQFKTDT